MTSRFPLLLVMTLHCAAGANAQPSFTSASGITQVTIPGESLRMIAAPLNGELAHESTATINSDWTDFVSPPRQTITVSGAGWEYDQWTTPDAHLAYISDSSGNEEAFLILGNSTLTLTIQTEFDLLDSARNIPTSTTVRIRKAHTIGGLFGFGSDTEVTPDDFVYLWNGTGWTSYYVDGNGDWRKVGSFGTVNEDLVFPDEGIYVERDDSADLTLTFSGAAPGAAQVTTIPAPVNIPVSTRYPVATTVSQLGFDDLPGWNNGDKFYLWNGTGWTTDYTDANGIWRKIGSFFPVPNDPIPGNTAVFVQPTGSATPEESANVHELPYTP